LNLCAFVCLLTADRHEEGRSAALSGTRNAHGEEEHNIAEFIAMQKFKGKQPTRMIAVRFFWQSFELWSSFFKPPRFTITTHMHGTPVYKFVHLPCQIFSKTTFFHIPSVRRK